MFKTKACLLLCCLVTFASIDAKADGPMYLCEACRDASINYVDYGNFAFNAVWGANPWVGPGGATLTSPLQIRNLDGQVAQVFFDVPAYLIPNPGNTMTIKVRLPNGTVVEYNVLMSDMGSDLPVGDSGASGSGGSSGGGSGGSSGGGNYVPGGLLGIEGDNGNYCGAGTPYDCVYR